MTNRRAVLTVDLDCPKCLGLGHRPRMLRFGYGPSAQEITVSEPCKCVRVAPVDDAKSYGHPIGYEAGYARAIRDVTQWLLTDVRDEMCDDAGAMIEKNPDVARPQKGKVTP